MWLLLLLIACVAAVASTVRLCHAAATAAALTAAAGPPRGPVARGPLAPPAPVAEPGGGVAEPGGRYGARPLSPYETAFLAGGQQRVADLTLVSMARKGRVLLAHTGWATVVAPEGGDELERSVITAIGPEGQSRVPAVRAALSGSEAVRAVGDRLAAAGLAVPPGAAALVAAAVRQVRLALALVLVAGATAVFVLPPADGAARAAAWFALPLAVVTGALLIARAELPPGELWASPAGRRLLVGAGPATSPLTDFALRGAAALDDPSLRAALTGTAPAVGHLRGPR